MITKPELPPKEGYVEVEVDGKRTYRNVATGELIEDEQERENSLEYIRAEKLLEISASCSAAIYAGVSVGRSHYSLTEHDQMELTAQYTLVKEGAQAVHYHADGELCRMYPADEFTALARVATAHVFYHRTYCNHLLAWIRRVETAEELATITYGAALPEDLAAHMEEILNAQTTE